MLAYIRTIKVTISQPSSNTTGKCLIIKTNKTKTKRTFHQQSPPQLLTQPFTQPIPQTCLPAQRLKCLCPLANGTRRAKHAPAPTTPAKQLQKQAVTLPTLTPMPPTGQPQAVARARATATPRPKAAGAATRARATATPKTTAAAARAPWS